MKHLLLVMLLAAGSAVFAQDVYKARLRLVPIDGQLQRTMSGEAQATATLTGTKLTVTGTFENLPGAATTAKIHQGVKMGVRGMPILDLTIAKATSGAISGTVDLNAAQVEALKAGRLYIQIASEKAPDGNLWGWLTK